jgi:hypothetical protein
MTQMNYNNLVNPICLFRGATGLVHPLITLAHHVRTNHEMHTGAYFTYVQWHIIALVCWCVITLMQSIRRHCLIISLYTRLHVNINWWCIIHLYLYIHECMTLFSRQVIVLKSFWSRWPDINKKPIVELSLKWLATNFFFYITLLGCFPINPYIHIHIHIYWKIYI